MGISRALPHYVSVNRLKSLCGIIRDWAEKKINRISEDVNDLQFNTCYQYFAININALNSYIETAALAGSYGTFPVIDNYGQYLGTVFMYKTGFYKAAVTFIGNTLSFGTTEELSMPQINQLGGIAGLKIAKCVYVLPSLLTDTDGQLSEWTVDYLWIDSDRASFFPSIHTTINRIEERFNIENEDLWSSIGTVEEDVMAAREEMAEQDLIVRSISKDNQYLLEKTRSLEERIVALEANQGSLAHYVMTEEEYSGLEESEIDLNGIYLIKES